MGRISIRGAFFTLTLLNLIVLLFFLNSSDQDPETNLPSLTQTTQTRFNTLHFTSQQPGQEVEIKQDKQDKTEIEIPKPKNDGKVYYFDDPALALRILEQLDVFSVIKLDKDIVPPPPETDNDHWNIKDTYCDEVRTAFVKRPEIVFTEKRFTTDFWKSHNVKNYVIKLVGGEDVTPERKMRKGVRGFYRGFDDTRTDIVFFFMNQNPFKRMQVGKHFSCLSQVSNHIPGRDIVASKENVGNALVEYSKMYRKRPQCFNFDSLFPKTWVLTKKEQCKDFFREFTGPVYEKLKKERGLVYFRKLGNGVHRGQGVFPVNETQEKYLMETYQNGKLCGTVEQVNVMQYAVQNPLLLDGHKFHFRVYMFVASTNPIIAYYRDGYIRLAVNKYDPESKEIDTFVTNLGITRNKAGDESAFQGMDQKEIKEATFWVYEQLQDYVLKNKLTSDPNWLDNHLRKEFKKVMVHLIRMSKKSFFRQSSLSELYGLDFLMDDKLNVWFIEANPMPMMTGWSDKTHDYFNTLLKDDFEIVLGLLKSRMKRVVLYLNEITKGISGDNKDQEDVNKLLPDIEVHRKKFQEITQNYFEPEFEPSPENGFQKIVDEHLEGTERYMGIFDKECL